MKIETGKISINVQLKAISFLRCRFWCGDSENNAVRKVKIERFSINIDDNFYGFVINDAIRIKKHIHVEFFRFTIKQRINMGI